MSEDLIFLDDFGITLTMTRPHARAPLGERVRVSEPFPHGSTISVLSAMGVHGVCAPLMIEGAVNSEGFAVYVPHLLAPGLRPGPIVLLDHVKFPYAPKAIELLEAAGARGLYLPPTPQTSIPSRVVFPSSRPHFAPSKRGPKEN